MLIFPVFIPQQGCPFRCIYCDQSSFDSTKAIPFNDLESQIKAFVQHNRDVTKQIAFYGGTFTGLPLEVQNQYYELLKPYLDDKTSIRISTRPDYIDSGILNWCKEHSVKTIELGIQDFSDDVLAESQRGYTGKTAFNACREIREAGFELGIQLMPGLPGSTNETIELNKSLVAEILPDIIRLYPVIVLSGTELYKLWEAGVYKLFSLDDAIALCADYLELCARNNIEVIKIGIPSLSNGTKYAGPYHPAFGELVKAECLIREIETLYQPNMTLLISPLDISLLTGQKKYSLDKLLNRLKICTIKIEPDSDIERGKARFVPNSLHSI